MRASPEKLGDKALTVDGGSRAQGELVVYLALRVCVAAARQQHQRGARAAVHDAAHDVIRPRRSILALGSGRRRRRLQRMRQEGNRLSHLVEAVADRLREG